MIIFVLRFGNELPCVSVHLLLQNGKSYFIYKFQEFSTLLNSVKKEFGALHSFRLKNSTSGSFSVILKVASLAQKRNFILSNNIIIICVYRARTLRMSWPKVLLFVHFLFCSCMHISPPEIEVQQIEMVGEEPGLKSEEANGNKEDDTSLTKTRVTTMSTRTK